MRNRRMRLLSFLFKWRTPIAPLPESGGRRINARKPEIAGNVPETRYVHFGKVMRRSGTAEALAAGDEEIRISRGSWLRTSEPLLDSRKVKPSVMAKNGGPEVPASENVGLELGSADLGLLLENSARPTADKFCEEELEATELQGRLNKYGVIGNSSLEGNEGLAGSIDHRQAEHVCASGNIGPESASRHMVPSKLGETVPYNPENSSPMIVEMPKCEFVSDSVRLADIKSSEIGAPPDGATNLRAPSESEVVAQGGLEEEKASDYPVPLSPLSGEIERVIEYGRAIVAETAMKSRPAISRSEVLFEDEWLMVINKPCGIYSEHVLATIPSLLCSKATSESESLVKDEKVSNEETHLHMANRLDRDTSGVMVITKCKKAAGKLSRIFTNRQVQKSYIALCAAPPPTWRHLTIESGHGRSRFGAWRVYAKRDIGRGLPGKCVVRDMITHFMVVALNKEIMAEQMESGGVPTACSSWSELKAKNNVVIAGEEREDELLPTSLDSNIDAKSEGSLKNGSLPNKGDEVIIRAFPFTGRTHQIRLHCQYVGMSLRGDVKYGGPHVWNGVQYDQHALHAETLSFRHPFTSEDLFLVAPLPQWAKDAGVRPLKG